MHRLMALAFLAIVLPLAACNTIEGLGQDVQNTGQSIEDTADSSKN